MPVTMLAPLLRLPADFIALNKEVRKGERNDVDRLGLQALGETLTDFADTAALIENLDLVITVDTAVAHLAGAIGRPVWILLDSRSDFRWLLDRDDSPWYPTARLFRQQLRDDWRGVIERVAEALSTFVAAGADDARAADAQPGEPARRAQSPAAH
jgi:hypothetical protein